MLAKAGGQSDLSPRSLIAEQGQTLGCEPICLVARTGIEYTTIVSPRASTC